MTEKNFTSEHFSHGLIVNAPVEKVFELIATPSGITKWFVGAAKFYYGESGIRLGSEQAMKGDSYLWKWMNKDLELKGAVLQSEKNKVFSFTFSPLYIVTIGISSEGERTRIILRQEYQESAVKDEFNFINCCVCWTFFLTNLKSVIEYGNDLREMQVSDEMLINI